MGIDPHKMLSYWTAIAWGDTQWRIPDYGRVDVASDSMTEERAILKSLHEIADRADLGWVCADTGEIVTPAQVWIDARYKPAVVIQFCKERNPRVYRPYMGFGGAQQGQRKFTYAVPTAKTKSVIKIGEEYHFVRKAAQRIPTVYVNADHWKSWLHARLSTSADEPGSILLFDAPARDHTAFVKQLLAEKQQEEFLPGRGRVLRWYVVSSNNHWGDSTYAACVAGHYAGVRVVMPLKAAVIQSAASDSQPSTGGWQIGR